MKRYMPVVETKFDRSGSLGDYAVMRTVREGDYVHYKDAYDLAHRLEDKIENLLRQLAKVTKERDDYGVMLDQAQALGEEVLTAAEHVQRQLAEVTRERDTLKAMVQLHDAMNDRRRAAQETTFKRRKYENE